VRSDAAKQRLKPALAPHNVDKTMSVHSASTPTNGFDSAVVDAAFFPTRRGSTSTRRAGSNNGSARIGRSGCDGYGPALRLEVQVSIEFAAAGS
jgi:hypothetical protein